MIQKAKTGEILTYVMEPIEKLVSWRFVAIHKPDLHPLYWFKIGPKPYMSLEMQAQHMNMEGGHPLHFHNFEEKDYV